MPHMLDGGIIQNQKGVQSRCPPQGLPTEGMCLRLHLHQYSQPDSLILHRLAPLSVPQGWLKLVLETQVTRFHDSRNGKFEKKILAFVTSTACVRTARGLGRGSRRIAEMSSRPSAGEQVGTLASKNNLTSSGNFDLPLKVRRALCKTPSIASLVRLLQGSGKQKSSGISA